MKDNEIYLDIFDNVEDSIGIEEDFEEESSDIAIVGMSLKTGSCQNSQELWEALYSGEELTRDFPSWRAEDVKAFCEWVGRDDEQFGRQCYLENIDLFSPDFFQILPKDASLIDPAQRIFLMTAWEALEDAGLSKKSLDGSNTGVFVGYTHSGFNYSEILSQSNPEYADRAIPGTVNSIIASRLSYWLNLRGPAVMIDTACSSSLAAVHTACNAILQGDCKQAIVGSVKINLMPLIGKGDNNISVLSGDGTTRTFDAKANGTNPGEGVASLILKPLKKAEQDKDRIYAVIKGSALNQDGASVGITAPNADAQEKLIIKAWENAKIDPEQISYIETHGTATKLGDPVEVTAIDRAFSRYTEKKQFCAVGSIKANLGHLDCAAGIFGLIKCIMELRNGILLPQINYESPNKEIDFISSAVYVNEKMSVWESKGPRSCGISSFGMSGTNCHVILQEYVDERESKNCLPMVLPLSANNEEDLLKIAELYKDYAENEEFCLSDFIYSVAIGRSDYDVRASVVIHNIEDIKKLPEQIQKIIKQNLQADFDQLDEEAGRKLREIVQYNKYNDDELQKICELYNKGANIDWEELYASFPVKKISVPGYPIKLQRCWEVPAKKLHNSYRKEGDYLIDYCLTSSDKLHVFETFMSEKTHTEVKEHIIGDMHVLAGTVYVEMLHCAAKKVLDSSQMQINNLIFLNPMIFEENQTRKVQTILYMKSEGKYDVTIQSKAVESKNWETHAQGLVELIPEDNRERPKAVDIQNIIQKLNSVSLDTGDSPVEQLVTTGPRWQVNKAMWASDEEAVTMAAIDSEFLGEINQYYLYPSMLDAAVNCSSVLNGANFCLPYYYGTLRIYDSIPELIYSHTVRNHDASSQDGEINSFDVEILAEDGRVIATVNNYVMKRAGTNQKKQFYKKEDSWLHTVEWIERSSDYKVALPDNDDKMAIIVRSIDDYNENLLEEIRTTYRGNIYELILCDWPMRDTEHKRYVAPDDLNKISSFFEECEETDIDQIIFMTHDHRKIDSNEELNNEIEYMLHAYYNITRAIALNKRLGNLRVNLLLKILDREIDPMANALQGMGKSLLSEYSRINLKCIFYSSDIKQQKIINELFINCNDYLIYLKDDVRFVQGMKELVSDEETSSENKFELRKGGTYIITGGLGGIGFELAKYLANMEADIRLVLISRRNLCPREEWKNNSSSIYKKLCQLAEQVKELRYYSCDVSDEKMVDMISNELNSVNGIIHAAGIAGGGFIIKKEWSDFLNVIKPKMNGTMNMLKLGRKFGVDFTALFSSYSTVLPVTGQSDYIAANSFIDALAKDNYSEYPIKVINWSGWKECGMAFDNGGEMNRTPVVFLTNAEGTKMFAEAMKANSNQVLVGKINCEVLAEVADDYNKVINYPQYVNEKIKQWYGKAKTQKEFYNITVTGKDSPLTDTETKVSQAWAKVLGFKEINYRDKFLEIGGDSLSATYLQKELDISYPNAMDITDVFIYSSIKDMADYIDGKMGIVQNAAEDDNFSSETKEQTKDETVNSASNDLLSDMLKKLEAGEIDVNEVAKYI